MSIALKVCRMCSLEAHTEEDLEAFSNDKAMSYGKKCICRDCNSDLTKSQDSYNRERRRIRHYEKAYGLTIDTYDRLLVLQEGSCAICKGNPTGTAVHFTVDHNHKTGLTRGLLCSSCNRGLGLLKDNAEILGEAMKYLRERGTYAKE